MVKRSQKLICSPSLTGDLKALDKSRRRDRVSLTQSEGLVGRLPRNDRLPHLETVNVPVDDLRTPKRALRKLNPGHTQEVLASINAFGFCDPLLIDGENCIVDGLARFEAAKLAGLASVPVIKISHLSNEELRVLRVGLNRLAEKGAWDLEELKLEFEELLVLDAPIELSGFAPDEIDQIIVEVGATSIERGLEPKKGGPATALVGDVFQLGGHRLICGDATEDAVMQQLMKEENGDFAYATLILTDEPYNVKIAGNVTTGDHREFAMASGEMTSEEFLSFNLRWMGAVLPYLRDGGLFGTFIDWRGAPAVHRAATKLGMTLLNLVVWAKTNAGLGSLYRSQFELLPLFKKGDAPNINNIALGRRGRWRSNIWSYPGASSLGSDARRGLKHHPTVKPTEMLKDALIDLTHRGDIVIDPFLGSGSTLIAAERTGRVCRGIELDPIFVDLIVRRFELETGESAKLLATGESFTSLSARRLIGFGEPSEAVNIKRSRKGPQERDK